VLGYQIGRASRPATVGCSSTCAATGGFVIAPGSIHASGVMYLEGGDWSVPRDILPVFNPCWLQAPAQRAIGSLPPRRLVGDLAARAQRYIGATPRPEIGCGSDAAVFRIACKLVHRFQLSEHDAISLIWDWAGNRDGWTLEWVVRKVRNAVRYGAEAVGS
jgi:hypothetical protein